MPPGESLVNLVTSLRCRKVTRPLSGGYGRLEVFTYDVLLATLDAWLFLVRAFECMSIVRG